MGNEHMTVRPPRPRSDQQLSTARQQRSRAPLERAVPSPAQEKGETPARVLFVHPSYPNQFCAIAEALNQEPSYECYGLVHQALAPQPGANGRVPYFGFVPDGQVDAYAYPFSTTFENGLRNARGILYALLNLMPHVQFDVIVGYAGFGSILMVKQLTGAAVLAYSELPGYHSAAARPAFPLTMDQALSSQAFEALNYASLLQADLCVVPSQHTRRLFPPELQPKIRVQMEGFDAEAIPAGGPAQRAALGLPSDAPIVGFFSRTLEAVRGFDIFLNVARRLHELDPAIQFVVIGDEQTLYGNEAAYLNGQTFKHYALNAAGVPETLFRWFNTMPYERFREHIACLDLVILPLFEGAANWSLFEAMAVGLPILSSNRCYVPEAIRNGRDGILLDPYDVEGYAQQALALLRDPRRARLLGRSARERVRQRFSVQQAAQGYRRIIDELVAQRRGAP